MFVWVVGDGWRWCARQLYRYVRLFSHNGRGKKGKPCACVRLRQSRVGSLEIDSGDSIGMGRGHGSAGLLVQ